MERPLLLLSDTHISRDYGQSISRELARLIQLHPDAELVLNGDVIDLSLEAPDECPEESLARGLAPHTELIETLRTHVANGGKLTFLPGNHDASLNLPTQAAAFRKLLAPPQDECVEISSWFCRRGNVHIEHGHLYDPDCAPNHPLSDANPHSEGLGTALMRRFVAPNEALFFAHANQTTPVSGLKTAVQKWGFRAPLVIYNYFELATRLCLEGTLHKSAVAKDRSQGRERLESYAESQGVQAAELDALLNIAPKPTHHSSRDVFLRLYFDRIFAGLSLSTGLGLLATSGLSLPAAGLGLGSGALLTVLGSAYLGHNVLRHKNRYGDLVIGQLDSAAKRVKEATSTKLVVFGHTHVEVDQPGYINLGSFGFPRSGRPYVLISTDERAARHHWCAA